MSNAEALKLARDALKDCRASGKLDDAEWQRVASAIAAIDAAQLAQPEPDAIAKDAARLRFLEDQTMEGSAPNLVFDDDGNWCVSYTGMQPMPRGDGRGFDETVTIACIVEPNEWRPSIRAAIDAAMAEAAGQQPA